MGRGAAAAGWADFARRLAAAGGSPGFAPGTTAGSTGSSAFGRAVADDAAPGDWGEELELASWAARIRISRPNGRSARGPDWWRRAEVAPGGRPALLALAGWPDSWKRHPPGDWGEVAARWFAVPVDAATARTRPSLSPEGRAVGIGAVRVRAGAPAPPARGGLGRRPPASRSSRSPTTRGPSRSGPSPRPSPRPTPAIRRRSATSPESSPGWASPRRSSWRRARVEAEGARSASGSLAEALAERFDRPEALRWALRQGDHAVAWLRPWLRRRLALPDDREGRRAMLDATPAELRPSLARAVLDVASDPGLPDDAFVWGVEEVLLPIPEADRPGRARVAGTVHRTSVVRPGADRADLTIGTRALPPSAPGSTRRGRGANWAPVRSRGSPTSAAWRRPWTPAIPPRSKASTWPASPAVDRGQVLARLLKSRRGRIGRLGPDPRTLRRRVDGEPSAGCAGARSDCARPSPIRTC